MDLITNGNESIKPQKNNAYFKFLRTPDGQNSVVPVDVHGNEYKELIECIKSAKNEWESANLNFEYAEDNELIDYFTYEIKACEVRYEYFLKKAKEKGISINI